MALKRWAFCGVVLTGLVMALFFVASWHINTTSVITNVQQVSASVKDSAQSLAEKPALEQTGELIHTLRQRAKEKTSNGTALDLLVRAGPGEPAAKTNHSKDELLSSQTQGKQPTVAAGNSPTDRVRTTLRGEPHGPTGDIGVGLPNDQKPSELELQIPRTIPKIIHQQWDSHKVPRKFSKYIQSWSKMHPGWDYVFWTPADVKNMLGNYYHHGLAQYQNEKTILMRTDIMRFYMLHKLGGFYLDLDMECLRPFDPWVEKADCFITENAHEHSMLLDKKDRPTALMPIAGCRSGHPFYELAMKMLDDYQKLTFMEKHLFTDMVFVEYNKTQRTKPASDRIKLMEPGLFLSIMDPHQFVSIKATCMKQFNTLPRPQQRVCLELKDRNYENKIRPYSYSVHYWEHFVMWNPRRKLEDTVSIYDIVPTAKNATEYLRSLDPKFVTDLKVAANRLKVDTSHGRYRRRSS